MARNPLQTGYEDTNPLSSAPYAIPDPTDPMAYAGVQNAVAADPLQQWLSYMRSKDRGATPIWNANNRVGTETVQSMGMPQPTVYGGPIGQYVNPYTGQLTAQGAERFDNPAFGLAPADVGLIGAVKVPTRAGNIARVDMRDPRNALADVSPATGKAVGKILDEHLAEGDIDLYGGRQGGEGSDYTVTLPPGVTRPIDLQNRATGMVDRATAMTQGVPEGQTPPRYWYKEGAEAFHDYTGRDFPATERLAAGTAWTSPQTDVAGNQNIATNAWNQSLLGHPIQIKTAPQNAALEDVLYGSSLPESRKVGPFFENHMRYLDLERANNLTNDIWQMRESGYRNVSKTGEVKPYEGTPSVGEDNYTRLMVDKAVRELNGQNVDGGGWTHDQVQAALWVHAKTLMEQGTASPNMYNFKHALERLHAGQGNAHQAGPRLLGDAASDPQAQQAFGQATGKLLTDQYGRDIVNHSLGMLTPPGVPGGASVAITADGIKPSSRTLMDAGTLMRATLLRQPEALWTAHPDVKGVPTLGNSNVVTSHSSNPTEHAMELRSVLDNAGGGLKGAVLMKTPGGVRIVNIPERTGITDNKAFTEAVTAATKRLGDNIDLKRGRADYGYFTHDWDKDPSGSAYIQALSRLPPHLQRVGDQLFARLGGGVDAEASAISGTQGNTGPWRVPGFSQAVGPVGAPLPLRPWIQRPSPTDPGSNLNALLLAR